VMKCSLGSKVSCVKADVFEDPPAKIGTFDLIVSNPPYIRTMDILTLDPSVRDYEPMEALNGGEDGYDFYGVILEKWRPLLRDRGRLMFEVGEEQAETVMEMMKAAGFERVKAVLDTAGTQRVIAGELL